MDRESQRPVVVLSWSSRAAIKLIWSTSSALLAVSVAGRGRVGRPSTVRAREQSRLPAICPSWVGQLTLQPGFDPAQVERAAQEGGQPLGLLLGPLAYPTVQLAEGLDLQLQTAALALVAPDAIHTPVHQEDR